MTQPKQDPLREPWPHTYANWMRAGVVVGLTLLVASFVVYIVRLLPPSVPHEQLPSLWSLPVKEYLARTGAPSGWSWVRRLHQGDVLNFLGVAALSTVTLACYARIIMPLLKSGERILAAIAIAQVLVIAIAATGWLR